MIQVDAFIRSFRVAWSTVKELDVVSYRVHAVKGEELVNGNFTPTASNMVYEGPSNSYIHILPKDAYGGMYYIKIAAVDTFGADELNYSDLVSVYVPDLQIMPDELFTSLRADFYLRDCTFLFGEVDADGIRTDATTLHWDNGWIDRADKVYELKNGSIEDATDSYIIATLTEPAIPEDPAEVASTVGSAELTKTAFSAGLPTLEENQIIIAVTSSSTNAVGNYMCYVRQGNSMMMEGAYIRDATIGDAKIYGTLSAHRITTLYGGVEIVENGIKLTDINSVVQDTSTSRQNIEDMSSDNKLTPVEKLSLKQEYQPIQTEYSTVVTQATTYGISTTALTTAYNTLNTFVSPLLADVTTTSTCSGSTLRTYLTAYSAALTKVQQDITAKVNTDATNAIAAANSAALAASTAQATATTASQQAQYAATTAVWGNLQSPPTGYNILKDSVGTGLQITSNYMGYYAGNSVGAYMDKNGYFYLKGATGDNSLTWNGSTLTVRGYLTAYGGKINNLSVDTLDIAGNAVTFPVGATSAGSTAEAWVANPYGSPVMIIGTSAYPYTFVMAINRNGSTIFSQVSNAGTGALSYMDMSGVAGTVKYEVVGGVGTTITALVCKR